MQTLWDTLAGPPAAIPGPAPAGGEPQGAITRRQRRPLRRDPRPPHRRARAQARPSLPRKPDQAAPRVPDSAGEAPPAAAAAGPLKWRSPRQPADASKELEGEGGGDGGRVRPRVCGRTCRLPALPRRFSALPGARPISGHGRPVTTATGRLFPPSHLSRHAAGRSRPPACRSDAAANGRPANASRGKRSSQSGAVAGAGRVLGRGGL